MANPNWAEALSAKAALCSAIASCVGAVATVGGVIAAVFALRWARKAAQSAGCQADSSLSAAKAAAKQVEILERQILLSEARPIVLLNITYQVGRGGSLGMHLENLGETFSFDVQVSPIEIIRSLPESHVVHTMSFDRIAVLRNGEKVSLLPNILPQMPGPSQDVYGQSRPPSLYFLDRLVSETLQAVGAAFKDTKARTQLATIRVTYHNARGRPLEKTFALTVTDEKFVECKPETSLVC